jgi:hypothetical protein
LPRLTRESGSQIPAGKEVKRAQEEEKIGGGKETTNTQTKYLQQK